MSTIVITYDGDDISNHVIFESATFESQLGAFPGSFEFTVRDENQEFEFVTGREISLEIDSTKYFGGYVVQVSRTFPFPVVDTVTDGPGFVTARQWVIRGVDYNILFDKRVVYNKDSPTQLIPLYSGGTTDAAVLTGLFDNYLDIQDDGLDTSTYIEAVSDPTPDGEAGAYVNPGEPWRKQMDDIVQFTGALYYIDAEKNIHYQAVEDVSPAWGFSDTPDHTTTYGFREFEFIEDGTNIVNDALVWGGSMYGSTGVSANTVFAETYNDVSAAANGRWQLAEKHFGEVGYFKTSGVALRGKIIVYGDPGAAGPGLGDQNRGLQNPQKNVRLTWFSGGVPTPLVAGSVVTVALAVWDVTVALPVRSIRITFPINTEARFEAFLGIQTSDPWSLWKYLKKVQQNPATPPLPPPFSDGSDPSVPPGTGVGITPSPAPDGSNTTFTIPYGYQDNSTEVYVNGLRLRNGIDYIESDSANGEIEFVVAPLIGDVIYVNYVAIPTSYPPFSSRPASGPISLNSVSGSSGSPYVISNLSFSHLGTNVISIELNNCSYIRIQDCDFDTVAEGVFAGNSDHIELINCRAQNITGPAFRDGHHRGNLIQIDGCSEVYVGYNKVLGGDTEDIVSLFGSSNNLVEYNHFENPYWQSNSGTGCITGDGGGSNNEISNNILVNVGQVGINIISGFGHVIDNNILIGQQRTGANVGISIYNPGSDPCGSITITNNRVLWYNEDGSFSAFYNDGGCGSPTMSGNVFDDTSLDINDYRVVL